MLEMAQRVWRWPTASSVGVWGVAGALIGIAMHNGSEQPWSLALGLVAVWLWGRASRRQDAFAAMLGYYLGTGRGLILGTWTFFGGGTEGAAMAVVAWLVPALLMGAAWGLAWGRAGAWWRAVAVLVVLAVPPIGIVGWGSPLTAAGVLFPGFGIGGLVLMMVVAASVATWGEGSRGGVGHGYVRAIGMTVVLLVVFANGFYKEPAEAGGWGGMDTYHGQGKAEGISVLPRLIALGDEIKRAPSAVTVFPELVGGNLATNRLFWVDAEASLRQQGRTALLGGIVLRDKRTLDNALVALGAGSEDSDGSVMWVNRVPVPVAMWRPWASDGQSFAAHWGADGVRRWRGERVASLICYEQFLVWPAVLTAAARPDRLLAVSNVWWARNTPLPGIQLAVSRSWARLMGVPVVVARNW